MEAELLSVLRKSIPRKPVLLILESLSDGCRDLTVRTIGFLVREISKHLRDFANIDIKIELLSKPKIKDISVFYDKLLLTIFVNPELLAKDLMLYYSCVGVDPIDALFYIFMHEYGHHQLNIMSLNPITNIESRGYYAIYCKFEDYVISKFLREDQYRKIESRILLFNALRSYEALSISLIDNLFEWHIDYLARTIITKYMDNIATVALALALDYLETRKIVSGIPERVSDVIKTIETYMRQVSEDEIKLIPKLAYKAWFDCYKKL